ncbi:hypothetical protein HK405_012628, partial [Cladochytrium tenue]
AACNSCAPTAQHRKRLRKKNAPSQRTLPSTARFRSCGAVRPTITWKKPRSGCISTLTSALRTRNRF